MVNIIDRGRVGIGLVKVRFSRYGDPLRPYFPAIFFIGGFIFDIFTLGRIDNLFNILSHILYLILVLTLLLTQILGLQAGKEPGRLTTLFFTYRNEAVHFLLGALLNAFVIFFFKSGTVVNTSLLLLLLAALLVINELDFFRARGPALKMVLFNISLCCFFIYLMPVLLGRISGGIFLLSLGGALLVNLTIWQLLLRAGVDFAQLRRAVVVPAGAVVLGFALLYGLKMIPPVPLSLMQIGIYHNLERRDGAFILYRQTPAWRFWSQGDQNYLAQAGDRLYLFCRIFAPGGFRDRLYFRFEYRNVGNAVWQTTDRIPMIIVGGRTRGFRGYAFKDNYMDGDWRALVETDEGLEIGRINFRIERSLSQSQRNFFQETY